MLGSTLKIGWGDDLGLLLKCGSARCPWCPTVPRQHHVCQDVGRKVGGIRINHRGGQRRFAEDLRGKTSVAARYARDCLSIEKGEVEEILGEADLRRFTDKPTGEAGAEPNP